MSYIGVHLTKSHIRAILSRTQEVLDSSYTIYYYLIYLRTYAYTCNGYWRSNAKKNTQKNTKKQQQKTPKTPQNNKKPATKINTFDTVIEKTTKNELM